MAVEGGIRRWWSALAAARLDQFTYVMATGIVSTALRNTGADLASLILFWLAVVGYVGLLAGVLAGLGRSGPGRARRLLAQIRDRRFATLAFTAAAGVLATRLAAIGQNTWALVLIIVATVSWVLLEYTVISGILLSLSRGGETGLARVDGTWLLWVVATQSIGVSAAAYAHAVGSPGMANFATVCWGIGILQLVIVAVLVGARLLLVPMRADDEVAPYWVLMGAGAISVLAAAEILGTGTEQAVMSEAVVGAVAMAIWSFITWLVPMLIALTHWQTFRPGGNRRFRAALWAMVFPIGMYGEATRQLGHVRDTGWMVTVGLWESWVALAVWVLVALGMLGAFARWVSAGPAGAD
ncbi:tellurite resistance/C4-dicarboxylate transporter family protein [Gordonia sp. DT30]|uniref:tellurite resistance/C4-dicarboxylate transporter family protein n=1 Tax=Gordonia sp. DT30 TaxID=3416546 RepID=UPI003CF5E66F